MSVPQLPVRAGGVQWTLIRVAYRVICWGSPKDYRIEMENMQRVLSQGDAAERREWTDMAALGWAAASGLFAGTAILCGIGVGLLSNERAAGTALAVLFGPVFFGLGVAISLLLRKAVPLKSSRGGLRYLPRAADLIGPALLGVTASVLFLWLALAR